MTQQHQDIDSLIERADRMLDGMAVNRDLFARDTKRMAGELAKWRDAHARSQPENLRNTESGGDAGVGQFTSAFNDLFKGFGS